MSNVTSIISNPMPGVCAIVGGPDTPVGAVRPVRPVRVAVELLEYIYVTGRIWKRIRTGYLCPRIFSEKKKRKRKKDKSTNPARDGKRMSYPNAEAGRAAKRRMLTKRGGGERDE